MINFLLILVAVVTLSLQSVEARRVVNLSGSSSYTDHIDLDGNRAVMAKFIFDQGKNQLSLSLITPSQHFALWDNTPYGHAVGMGKLKSKKLPFATQSDSKVTYKVGKGFKSEVKSNTAKGSKAVMQSTITVQGATPVELPLLINQDIEQVDYTITSPSDTVYVDLGGLIIMELDKQKKSGKRRYKLVSYQNMDNGYRVKIERDACFGRDAELELAKSRCDAVRSALESLKVMRDDALVANTKEKEELFEKMKSLTVKSYARIDSVDVCNQINAVYDDYNKYADSVANIKLDVKSKSKVVDAKYLLSQTQKIDSYMATMQYSNDSAERENARDWTSQVIREVNEHINSCEVTTREGREAINVFYRAEGVFYKITMSR